MRYNVAKCILILKKCYQSLRKAFGKKEIFIRKDIVNFRILFLKMIDSCIIYGRPRHPHTRGICRLEKHRPEIAIRYEGFHSIHIFFLPLPVYQTCIMHLPLINPLQDIFHVLLTADKSLSSANLVTFPFHWMLLLQLGYILVLLTADTVSPSNLTTFLSIYAPTATRYHSFVLYSNIPVPLNTDTKLRNFTLARVWSGNPSCQL